MGVAKLASFEVSSQKSYQFWILVRVADALLSALKRTCRVQMVTAIDISADALHTAKQNAVINEVKVEFIEQDIFGKVRKSLKEKVLQIRYSSFDVIISNPPYVTLEDKLQMHQNVTGFEPHSALFVPEHDPLIFYKAIADYAAEHLSPGGLYSSR
jgi:release factor glutamine methyltransferase